MKSVYKCAICQDVGWACEKHPSQPHEHKILKGFIFIRVVECSGAGMPCICNKNNPLWDYHNP